jgi:hypothetical protein
MKYLHSYLIGTLEQPEVGAFILLGKKMSTASVRILSSLLADAGLVTPAVTSTAVRRRTQTTFTIVIAI